MSPASPKKTGCWLLHRCESLTAERRVRTSFGTSEPAQSRRPNEKASAGKPALPSPSASMLCDYKLRQRLLAKEEHTDPWIKAPERGAQRAEQGSYSSKAQEDSWIWGWRGREMERDGEDLGGRGHALVRRSKEADVGEAQVLVAAAAVAVVAKVNPVEVVDPVGAAALQIKHAARQGAEGKAGGMA